MSYSLTITVQPSSEPVSVATFKDHARVNTGTAEDTLIAQYITAARLAFEKRTNLAVKPTTFKLSLDAWSNPIYLPRGIVPSVSSVKYYDTGDTLQTMDPADYV